MTSHSTTKRDKWSFKNKDGLKIQMYQERPNGGENTAPLTQAVLLCHGLQSHFELEFTTSIQRNDHGEQYVQADSEHSWARTLVRESPTLGVFGIDHQGHGDSEAWHNTRTNVEHFDNYGHDIIEALKQIDKAHPGVPICIVGISLGGAIVCRTLQMIGALPKQPVNLQAAVMLCPAISIEILKSKWINKIALPFAAPISKIAPHFKVGAVETHPFLACIPKWMDSDPKTGEGMIPARLSNEALRITTTVFQDGEWQKMGLNNQDLHVKFLHSKADGFVDHQGSIRMYELITLKNKEIKLFEEDTGLWHFLTLEPGTMEHSFPEVQKQIAKMDSVRIPTIKP